MTQTSGHRFCGECGADVGGGRFCRSCGASQQETTTPTPPVAAAAPPASGPARVAPAAAMPPSGGDGPPRSAAGRRGRSTARWAAAALATAAVAAVAVVVGRGDGGEPERGRSGETTGASAAAVDTFDPGIDPTYLALTSRYLWVLESDDPSRLARFDVATNEQVGTPTEQSDYLDEIVGLGDDLWIADTNKVIEVDGESAEPTGKEIATPVGITSDLVVQGDALWHVDYSDDDYSDGDEENGQLVKVDPASESTGAAAVVPFCTSTATAGTSAVYVGTYCAGTGVSRVDTQTNEVVSKELDVGGYPYIAAGDDAVWVTNQEDGTVIELDPVTLEQRGQPTEVGHHPQDLALLDGVLWIAVYGDDAVVRLDPKTKRRIGAPIRVGDKPDGLLARDGRVWVRNGGDDTISVIDAAKVS